MSSHLNFNQSITCATHSRALGGDKYSQNPITTHTVCE